MKIHLAKSAGFCFGVKRALDIAFHTVKSANNIFMLGDIVHNEDVVKQITDCGIRKIKRLIPGMDKTLLLRAHGASAKTIKRAKKLGFKIVDATCPMVKEIHKIVREMEQKGYKIIVIGDKKHEEVQGIIGQLRGKAIVIEGIKALPLKALQKIKKAAVVVQSTQNLEKVIRISETLKKYIKELNFFNTICMPTRRKQQEIRLMPLKNDLMIIIGSKTSANTKRLYEISKSLNKRSYWVQSKQDLKLNWFKNAKSIGITAGASTPNSTTQKIVEYIKQIS